MSKISVVIPVYNSEKTLRKCLDSVCNQTLHDIEILCINDGSTDSSIEILKHYEQKDSRIKIINFDINEGEAAVRNYIFDKINSPYFGYVDSDDTIDSNFYEVLYNNAIKNNSDISKGIIVKYDSNKQDWSVPEWSIPNSEISKNISAFINSYTTAIYKTEIIQKNSIKFNEKIKNLVDPYFLLQVTKCAKTFISTEDVKYYYYTTPASISNKRTAESITNTLEGIKVNFNLLNSLNFDDKSYMPMFKYLLNITIAQCETPFVPDNVNKQAIETLLYLIENCQYKREYLTLFFINKKNIIKKQLLNDLKSRTRSEK